MKIIKETDTKENYIGYYGDEFDMFLDIDLPKGTIITRDLFFGHRIIITGKNKAKLKDEKSHIDKCNFKIETEYYIVK